MNSILQAVREKWTKIKKETEEEANTAERVGDAGESIVDLLDVTVTDALQEMFKESVAQYVNSLTLIADIAANYAGSMVIDLSGFVGKSVLIMFQDGTIIYNGMITNDNKALFSFDLGVGAYSVMIKAVSDVTASEMVAVSGTINKYSFAGNTSITSSMISFTIPGITTLLPVNFLDGDNKVSEVIINEGVVGLGVTPQSRAFNKSNALRRVTIPNSFLNLSGAFNGTYSFGSIFVDCPNLQEIIINEGYQLPLYFNIGGDLIYRNLTEIINRAREVPSARTIYMSKKNRDKLLAEEMAILVDKNYVVSIIDK
jgi:hypothetical protein